MEVLEQEEAHRHKAEAPEKEDHARGAVEEEALKPAPDCASQQALVSMKTGKENILTAAAIVVLLATALVSWNTLSWLILLAAVAILLAWRLKK